MPPMPPPPGGMPPPPAFFFGTSATMASVVISNAAFGLLDFGFSRAADADHRDTACELGQTLLQLLTVVVRGGFLDLRLDLRHACLDVGLLAGAAHDRGVLLVDHHLFGATEHG